VVLEAVVVVEEVEEVVVWVPRTFCRGTCQDASLVVANKEEASMLRRVLSLLAVVGIVTAVVVLGVGAGCCGMPP
jgi:hypothetical protein